MESAGTDRQQSGPGPCLPTIYLYPETVTVNTMLLVKAVRKESDLSNR
jgi:hypothetical protein